MLEPVIVDDVEFKVDPNTNFWGIGDQEKLNKLCREMQLKLKVEMQHLRYSTDIILLYVNPTDRCNANCPYCYLPQKVKDRGKNMSFQELENIVMKASDFFNRKGTKGSVIFHGTEPLLNKDNLFQIIEKHEGNVHFGLQTNGFLLSKADAKFIKAHNINIGVSLDSPEQETNDFLRGEGHYLKIIDVLDWFRGYKGLNVVTTITSKNVNQLQPMVRFLSGKGVALCLMNPVRGTQEGAVALRPEPQKLAFEFLNAVEEAIRLTKAGKRIVVADFANMLLGIIAPSARVMMCDISPCGGGRRFFAIAADGKAYPCGEFIGMEEFVGGNIFTNSIEGIVASKNFLKVTRRMIEEVPECRTCVFRNMCGDPCPAEIYSTDKSMMSKSYYCEFYKQMALHAFRVVARNDAEFVVKKSALKEIYNLRDA